MTCFIRCLALVCGFAATSLVGCGESSFSTANGGGMANHGGSRNTGNLRLSAKGGRSSTNNPAPSNAGMGAEPVPCVPACNEGYVEVVGECPAETDCLPSTNCEETSILCVLATGG